MAIRRILLPVDYSACSGVALSSTLDLARTLDAEVDVIHVWDRPLYVPETVTVSHEGRSRSLVDMIRENAEREMDEFMARAPVPAGVNVTRRLLSGAPAATILKELESGRYDLLCIGTHGRTGVRHMLLGSVAETLVRLSPVPVLTLR
jgi:nucleotide-binding universal stress UspA family protein